MTINKLILLRKNLSEFSRILYEYLEKFQEFHRLSQEKQNRILNASFTEFALHGYINASTNAIVTKARIGKGMLFFYFKSKKGLCLYLFYKTIQLMIEFHKKVFLNLLKEKKDILELATIIGMERIKFLKKYPIESQFLMMIFIKIPESLAKEIHEFQEKTFSRSSDIFFTMLNLSKMRNGLDIEVAKNIVLYVLEGIFRSTIKYDSFTNLNLLDSNFEYVLEDMRKKILKYMEILRNGMYEK